MKYNLEKAVSKLSWRFGSDKPFKPNENDIEALNTIFGWINRQKKETLNNNVLFAKLYIHYKTMNIRRFETTVLDDFNVVNNEMVKILKTPLNLFYEAFHRDLHDNQLNKLKEYSDINDKIDINIKEIRIGKIEVSSFLLEKHKGLENYIAYYKKENYISELKKEEVIANYLHCKKTFTLDYLSNKVGHEITEALNRF